MSHQNHLKIHSTQREIAPHADRLQPRTSNLKGAVLASRSNSREAKKRLIATVANSKFHVSHEQQRALHISNRNKYALFEFVSVNSKAQLQVPLECLIASQKRVEIALTHSKNSLVAFSNHPKIHEVQKQIPPSIPTPSPAKPLPELVLEWGFIHV
jgi:hypothetical protein